MWPLLAASDWRLLCLHIVLISRRSPFLKMAALAALPEGYERFADVFTSLLLNSRDSEAFRFCISRFDKAVRSGHSSITITAEALDAPPL